MNPFLILIFFATIFETAADVLFRKWAVGSSRWFLSAGLILYFIGTVGWAYSLKYEQLSKAISVFTILNLILVVLAGVLFFNEGLSLANKLGILLGIISIILLEM